MPRAELLQYDIRHDWQEKDVQFLATQLETHLKERFNVLLSTVEYGIKNGHLARQGREEPFIETVKRGRDFIQKIDPRSMDIHREDAEPIGFEKIDSFLSDPATPINSKMLSISPKGEDGSKYQHNFYDIFTLKEKNRERYVELSRYSSGLTRRDYARRLGLDINNPPEAQDFLANPIKPGVQITPEQIHEALHVNHKYMDSMDFKKIWTSPFVQFYVKRYESNRDARSFNAVLNAADQAWENKSYQDYKIYTPSYGETRSLEEKKVRQAGGQCPGKSGADISNSPFSVSEFNFSYKFDQAGPCRECGADVLCGPCKLCKSCDLRIRASNKTKFN
jgi:hypothetical protein